MCGERGRWHVRWILSNSLAFGGLDKAKVNFTSVKWFSGIMEHFALTKVNRAHPARAVAIDLLRRGEITPGDAARALSVSRQAVHYWCKAAGIVDKTAEARRNYVVRRILKDMPAADEREPEHPAIAALRARLKRPRPDRDQINAAKDRKASDLDNCTVPGLPASEANRD